MLVRIFRCVCGKVAHEIKEDDGSEKTSFLDMDVAAECERCASHGEYPRRDLTEKEQDKNWDRLVIASQERFAQEDQEDGFDRDNDNVVRLKPNKGGRAGRRKARAEKAAALQD